jgi:hypothetical protein
MIEMLLQFISESGGSMAVYGYPFTFLFNQMRDGANGSLAGGSVTFYAAGTTTPKAVWLDRAMTSPSVGGVLTPITLSADGTATVFGLGIYKVVVKNSSGVTVYTYDNINQIDPSYSDDITAQLVNIETLTSPAQAQIDTKLTKVVADSTSTGTYANTGLVASLTAANSSTGKSCSVSVKSTGELELISTDGVYVDGLRLWLGKASDLASVAVGYQSLAADTLGNSNTAIGFQSLLNNTEGNYNSALGRSSLAGNTTGLNNTAVGHSSLLGNTTGSYNVAVGEACFQSNDSGSYNVVVGYDAGNSVTSGSRNTFIGTGAGKNASQLYNVTNSTAIGNGAYTNADNQVAIGNSSVVKTLLQGVVTTGGAGIGYGAGAGGTVTQTTSRTTGVTINKATGAITLCSAAGTTSWQSFTVTNSTVVATDVVLVSQKSGTDLNEIHVTAVAAGSFQITFRTTTGTTTEQPVFNFAVIKGVIA